ncbi:ciliogenesis-associated TTC17-interacting protein-like isoform X2 [Gigantopelta aegis]|uniref:ciliogenesis-associated TTC17-interacting protein-like isoform X2 n=1 Tax=Gigantopelta aegis TaxID=1735272 RepID=UPI001B888B8C|nr:ciliogenesis-associated TTC17-interacting protein-like isoform X2 [Gigantopelta aegis]
MSADIPSSQSQEMTDNEPGVQNPASTENVPSIPEDESQAEGQVSAPSDQDVDYAEPTDNEQSDENLLTAGTDQAGQDLVMSDQELVTDNEPVPLPIPNELALNFISSIDPKEDFKYLMFSDHLVTVSDTGKELGEFSVSIEPTKYHCKDAFLVHANSHGAVDNVPCGTSITCYVSPQLETLDQQHHEYVKLENCPLDRKTGIIKTEEGFIVNRIITQGQDVQRTSKTWSPESMKGFISEGSNLLLHRLLIEKTLPDDMHFISFDSDANLCDATYRGLNERTQTVQGVELPVIGIERTINSTVDLPTTWQSYFMSDCHLTNRVQVGSPVTMKLAEVPELIERDEEPPKPVFTKQPLNWEEDMQMYSKFLDRKEELKNDHAVYMHHHPELKALLADFLQFLLLRKPADVISFAADYFSAFSTTMPSQSPYLASNASTPFPASRTNTNIEKLKKSR